MSRQPEYGSWIELRRRCNSPSRHNYAQYGGRGIKVCRSWQFSFAAFLADMGPKPSPRHSIERRDTNGDYSPENCYWGTPTDQANNRTSNRIVVYRGQRMSLRQAIRLAGDIVEKSTVRRRIVDLGWPVEMAIETPARLQINNTDSRL